jgi:hypothetical protein
MEMSSLGLDHLTGLARSPVLRKRHRFAHCPREKNDCFDSCLRLPHKR